MIDVYADGADYNGIIDAAMNKSIKGFTTNPTLMKAAGVTDFSKFANDIIHTSRTFVLIPISVLKFLLTIVMKCIVKQRSLLVGGPSMITRCMSRSL